MPMAGMLLTPIITGGKSSDLTVLLVVKTPGKHNRVCAPHPHLWYCIELESTFGS